MRIAQRAEVRSAEYVPLRTRRGAGKIATNRNRLGRRPARAATLIAGAVLLLVSAAQSNDFDDFIEALNELVMQAGPVPGSLAEDLPQAQVNQAMAAAADDLSNGQTHTPDPGRANQFAFEGYELDAEETVTATELNTANLQTNAKIDVPDGSAPSPLFGASEFSQQLQRFEEFGVTQLGPETSVVVGDPFPAPADSVSSPDAQDLDEFLQQYVAPSEALPFPFPTRIANDPDNGGNDENPWKDEIEAFLGRELVTPPAEGRPPGEDWAHQRWEEFYPQAYFQTAQAGARTNTGIRDEMQLHQYSVGEFAPGGLYHNVTGNPGSDGTSAGVVVRFHPAFPVQDPNALWTFDGTFPPKLLTARYGESLLMRHYNALPISPAANFGFGLHPLATHQHNGHIPAESDGYTQAFFFPGQFHDYRWPMALAGYDSINTDASDPRAGAPDGNGGIRKIRGDWRETMSSLWFHDHMLDFTAANVYKGNAAMMNIYGSVDRGREPATLEEATSKSAYGCRYADPDNVNLCFPSGSGLDWGNRDYDVNLLIADKAWDAYGQLFFNIFALDGFLGDQVLTNWLWKPYLDVGARRYRFRILNASVSRLFRFALVEQVDGLGGELAGTPGSGISYNRVPFYMIANDGNIMEHAVYFDGNTTVGGLTNRKGILPTQAIAERYDILVDFAQFVPGTKLYLVNLLEHRNGRRPHQEIPLQLVLNGTYAPEEVTGGGGHKSDPTVTRILEFRVQAYDGDDWSMDPADFVAGGKKMIPLPTFTQEELDNAIHRTFEFKRSNGTDSDPWVIKTDGGAGFGMDPQRLSAASSTAHAEIWHLQGSGGWAHPIHVHFEEGQILKRDGKDPPEWEKWARKDVYRLGGSMDSSLTVDVALRFREFLGTFMEHCHNLQHEDHAMLLRWDLENPGQVRVMPTPMPTWDGVGYVPSYAVPTFRSGDAKAKQSYDEAVAAAPEESTEPPVTVVTSRQANRHGRIRIRGLVAPGQQVVADVPTVSCWTKPGGRFRCRGRHLEPGQPVTIQLRAGSSVQAPTAAGGVVARRKVNRRGRVRIRGAVTDGRQVTADVSGVSCRLGSLGRFHCRGRNLEPGQIVTIRQN